MEISSFRGFSELGMEDPSFIHQWQLNSLDQLGMLPLAAALGENLQQSFPNQTCNVKTSMETYPMGSERPVKQLKTNGWESCRAEQILNPQVVSSPNILSFVGSNYNNQVGALKPKEETVCSESIITQGYFGNPNYVLNPCQGAKRVSTSTRLSQAQDHIIAERKRREKLSQRFIALSSIVPGLKKTDKASVLGDAIKYLKQLQEQVKTLEEQTKQKTMESAVFVRKSQLFAEGENFSNGHYDEPLPEIEARISENNVLIRIHCEKDKGVLQKMVAEIEKLHLTVVNSSVLTFGSATLDVTFIAQMDVEFRMTVKDLVKNLHSTFKVFM